MKFLLITFLVPASLYAQLTVKGNVADAGSGRCIPFATIGLPGKESGSISKENGSFEFNVPAGSAKDKVLITAAGYKSKLVTADSLKSSKITIGLTPVKPVAIQKLKTTRKDLVGNLTDKHDLTRQTILTYPGSEEATLIKNTDTILVRSFHLRVDTLSYDSLLLRINLYSVKKGMPSEKLNQNDHYFQLQRTNNEVIKVVLNEPIIITNDFFASIEYIQGDGKQKEFSLSTFEDKHMHAYKRSVCHGDWKTEKVAAPGFWLEVEK